MDETFPKMAALNNAEKNIRVLLLSIRKQKMRKICIGISSDFKWCGYATVLHMWVYVTLNKS